MACSYEHCKVKSNSDQQLLSCWLCDALCHWSCAGFNGRIFDTIIDRSKGLRWSCLNCRSLDVDFYKMFKDAKLVLSQLKSDMTKVTENLDNMEALLSKFEYIDGSPKRKKTLHSLDNNTGNTLPNASNLISLLSPAMCENPFQNSIPSITETAPSIEKSVDVEKISEISPPTDLDPPTDHGHSAPNDIPGNIRCNTVLGSSPCVSSQDNGNASNPNLVVIPPRRTVFLSRLAPDTTTENIGSYIRSKLSDLGDDIVIFKFNFSQPRDISSFKIMAPGKYFDDIVSQNFWPEGVLVREYTHRVRNRSNVPVHLTSSNTIPKN